MELDPMDPVLLEFKAPSWAACDWCPRCDWAQTCADCRAGWSF